MAVNGRSLTEVNTSTAFKNFSIASSEFLDEIEGRSKCPECTRSRKFFCYTCFIPMEPIRNKIPKLELPVKVDIVKHRQEVDGKSTAIHATILAPGFAQVYSYPELPETENSILVFPSADAEDAEEFMKRMHSENGGCFPYERVIFIDCTWAQTYSISTDPRLTRLKKIKLSGIESLFWRYHIGNPSTHLSTIEAIYYFFRIYHLNFVSSVYSAEFDNLLFFFRYMFNKIRELYGPKSLRAYTARPYAEN